VPAPAAAAGALLILAGIWMASRGDAPAGAGSKDLENFGGGL
jgi:hypothetical protein